MQNWSGIHHSGQFRIYLFRKLFAPGSQQQREVLEEAIAELLGQVIGGNSSIVFCCGHSDTGDDAEDIVTRIFGELFSSENSLAQPEVSVRHVKLTADSSDLAANLTSSGCRTSLDYFVATPRELQAYIERVKGEMILDNECCHLMFTILVSQISGVDCGQLQLLHFRERGDDSRPTDNESELEDDQKDVKSEAKTPLETLERLLQALAHNAKTHLRYHNVKLTRLLKELLGNCGKTVLINFTNEPKRPEPVVPNSSRIFYNDGPSATVWQAMYRRERRKYCCLREKVLSQDTDKLKEMEEFLEGLEGSESPDEEGEIAEQGQDLMQQRMIEIRNKAELTISQMAGLKTDMEQLAELSYRQERQLNQKNRQLARLSKLLTSARQELRLQRMQFRHKLAEDLGQLSSLCRRQSKMQTKVHRRHLSELFRVFVKDKLEGEASGSNFTPIEDEDTDDEPPEKP